MPRTFLFSALLLGCSAFAVFGAWRSSPAAHALTASLHPADSRFARPLQRARDCKPLAPVTLDLRQTGASDGSVVDLVFSVTPHADVGPVTWELKLPADSVLLSGETTGTCDAEGGGSGTLHARVRLATADSLSRITLAASGALQSEEQSDAAAEAMSDAAATDPDHARAAARTAGMAPADGSPAEPIRATASLSWGDPQVELSAALPLRRLAAVDRDGTRRLAEVPTRHRSGR